MNANPSPKHQRQIKNLLINPSYQIRYIAVIFLTGALLVTVNAAVFYSYVSENYATLVDLSPMTDEARALLYSELKQILLILGMGSFGFLTLISVLALIMSHRTAGPLYHFKRVFGEIKSGNTQARVHLRPGDDFQEVARAFNEAMDQHFKKS